FADYFGSGDVIVTSGGVNDSGMFEPNARDERFWPFEGAGAISTWRLSLPAELRAFDYGTISDVIMHVRYTARDAGDPLAAAATKELSAMLDAAGDSSQSIMFVLKYDYASEWSAFVTGAGDFAATLTRQIFPYAVQSARKLTIDGLTLYADSGTGTVASVTPAADLAALSAGLSGAGGQAALALPADPAVLTRDASRQVFLVLRYHFGQN
ncbi:MAG TPA: hypothetical protein VMU66_07405, partial [Gaiellales bacterium]|nr:hypothetical protein [Gaiellales bacterium]